MEDGYWAIIGKEFQGLNLDLVLHIGTLACFMVWSLRKNRFPQISNQNFNVDGAARGKPSVTTFGGILCNSKCQSFLSLSKSIGNKIPMKRSVMQDLRSIENLVKRVQGFVLYHGLLVRVEGHGDYNNVLMRLKELKSLIKVIFLF